MTVMFKVGSVLKYGSLIERSRMVERGQVEEGQVVTHFQLKCLSLVTEIL